MEVSERKSIPLLVSIKLVAATRSTPLALPMTSKMGLTTAKCASRKPGEHGVSISDPPSWRRMFRSLSRLSHYQRVFLFFLVSQKLWHSVATFDMFFGLGSMIETSASKSMDSIVWMVSLLPSKIRIRFFPRSCTALITSKWSPQKNDRLGGRFGPIVYHSENF